MLLSESLLCCPCHMNSNFVISSERDSQMLWTLISCNPISTADSDEADIMLFD